jgi:murein DD-endopeptidase MepM/ murein hydrolase activator NlpD
VVISHGSGVQSWYWHLKAVVVVRAGQVVSRGQVIGYEGNTGNSTGCHLHFAINDHSVWENPRVYLP